PSLVLRGNATNPGGTLAAGRFGGGINGDLSNYGWRNSYDVQVLWELQGLGLGNRAAVREREADNRGAILELLRTQDRVAAEVAQSHAQAARAANRRTVAGEGLKDAAQTVKTNLEGVSEPVRGVLVFRPQEVVAAVQALDQAYRDYFGAVADANQAQFRLHRALGHPAQCVLAPEFAELRPPARMALPTQAPTESVAPAAHVVPLDTRELGPRTDFATDRRKR